MKGPESLLRYQLLGLILVAISAAVAFYLAWMNLPQVGGEWWFYVRAAGSVIVASVIATLAGAVANLFIIAVVMND